MSSTLGAAGGLPNPLVSELAQAVSTAVAEALGVQLEAITRRLLDAARDAIHEQTQRTIADLPPLHGSSSLPLGAPGDSPAPSTVSSAAGNRHWKRSSEGAASATSRSSARSDTEGSPRSAPLPNLQHPQRSFGAQGAQGTSSQDVRRGKDLALLVSAGTDKTTYSMVSSSSRTRRRPDVYDIDRLQASLLFESNGLFDESLRVGRRQRKSDGHLRLRADGQQPSTVEGHLAPRAEGHQPPRAEGSLDSTAVAGPELMRSRPPSPAQDSPDEADRSSAGRFTLMVRQPTESSSLSGGSGEAGGGLVARTSSQHSSEVTRQWTSSSRLTGRGTGSRLNPPQLVVHTNSDVTRQCSETDSLGPGDTASNLSPILPGAVRRAAGGDVTRQSSLDSDREPTVEESEQDGFRGGELRLPPSVQDFRGRPSNSSVSGRPVGRWGRIASFVSGMSGDRASVDQLRQQQEHRTLETASALKQDIQTSDVSEAAGTTLAFQRCFRVALRVPTALLIATGVLRFSDGRMSNWYANFMLFFAAGPVVVSLAQAATQEGLLQLDLANIFFAVGAWLGLFLMKSVQVDNLLGPTRRPLEAFAMNAGYRHIWRMFSLHQFCLALAAWVFTVGAKGVSLLPGNCPDGWQGSGRSLPESAVLASSALATWLLMALMYCILHIIWGLELAVDECTVVMFEHVDFGRAVMEWNLLQALLRRAASAVDSCILVVGTTVLATMAMVGSAALEDWPSPYLASRSGPDVVCLARHCSWVMPPVLLFVYMLFRAASVTEKCAKVPSLICAWTVEGKEDAINLERQFTVQHILHSAAGFYVKGVRLTALMALKLAYVVGLVLLSVVTRAIAQR